MIAFTIVALCAVVWLLIYLGIPKDGPPKVSPGDWSGCACHVNAYGRRIYCAAHKEAS